LAIFVAVLVLVVVVVVVSNVQLLRRSRFDALFVSQLCVLLSTGESGWLLAGCWRPLGSSGHKCQPSASLADKASISSKKDWLARTRKSLLA